MFKDGAQVCGPAADVLPLIRWGTPMSRVLTVLMAAGAMLAGAQAASAQYYGPVEYRDAPPRYYEERYDRDAPPRRYEEPGYYADPRYEEERLPFLSERGYGDRPRYRDPYGHGRPRRYYRGPRYEDYDLPPRGYADDDARDALTPPDEPDRKERGFDPRRPHLGDGTDAPSEQFYPRRPRSCGEFFYWDGRACVDARKYPPYVGPRR